MEDGSLKVIFSEVLRGYSLVESSFGKSRINHFTNFDSAALDIKNKAFYDKAIRKDFPAEKKESITCWTRVFGPTKKTKMSSTPRVISLV